MSAHVVAVTFGSEHVPTVWDVNALDPVHAILRVFADMPIEKHADVIRVQVSAKK